MKGEPDSDLLSPEIQPTIIGARAFHRPVRNGKGWGNSLPQVPADSIFAFIDKECADIQDSIIVNYGDLGDMSYYKEIGRAHV